jgi:hypothetical protein
MPLLDEDTAFGFAQKHMSMQPDKIDPLEVKALDEYAIHQQELGLPMFPASEAKARVEKEGYRSVFTDIKKVDEWEPTMKQIAANATDPDNVRQMFANSMFLATELGLGKDEVLSKYQDYLGAYSQQVWGKRVADTAGFYGMAQGHVKKQVEAEEVSGEAMRLALTSAAMGTNDSVGDYQKWKASMEGKAPTVDAHRQYSAAYNQVKARIEPYKPIVAGAVKSLKQLMAGEGATAGTEQRIVDAIIDLPPQDRPLVLASIMAGAQATGEGADKDWTTLFPQIGESFSRIINASWGGMGRQELATNLRTAKAEYLGGKDGKMLLPESPIETPEQARELVKRTLLEVTGKKTGLMQMGMGASTGMGGGPVYVPPIGDEGTKRFRTPTEQERSLINSEMNRVTRTNQITREIENAAVATDPVKALFANAIGSTLALVPVSMMGPGGVMVATKAYAGMEYDKIRLQYPTIPEDKVAIISNLSGFVMAGLDKIEGDFLTGKLPSVSKIIQKGIFSTVLGRVGVRAIEGVTFQNLQEGFQDASRLVIQDIYAAINSDVEGTDISEYSQFWDSRLDVAIDMIPLNLIGLGAGTYQDFANATATMQRRDLLNLAGVNDEAAASIIELTRKGDVEGAQTALREAFLNRDPEVARAASERMGPAEVAAQQFDTNLTRSLAPRYTQEGDNHVLTFPDGRVIKAESWSEARWYMEQAMGDTLNQEISTVAELGNFFTSQQREGMTETLDVIPEQRTIQQDVAEGVITEEQARERAAIAGEAFGLTPEEAQEEAWTVLGRNTTDTQNDVAQSAIQLFEGADVSTVVEEVVEGRLKAALAQNKYSTEQVKKFIAQVESATGETFMVNDTEQGITEAISAIVVADVLGRRKDGTQLPAGLVTRGMLAAVQRQSTPKANRRLMGMVQAFRSFFRQVFARAKALNKAKGEGKLGAEYQGFVDELLGVDPQVRELNVAAVEARAMVGTATGETQVEDLTQRPVIPEGEFFNERDALEEGERRLAAGDLLGAEIVATNPVLESAVGGKVATYLLAKIGEARVMVETQVEEAAPKKASQVSGLGVVRYAGVTGRLERLGERYVIKPKTGPEVELSGEDFVDVVFETDEATLAEFAQPAPVEMDGRTGAPTVELTTGFTPARDGTLSITTPDGRTLVPVKRELSKNVVKNRRGTGFKLKEANDRFGDSTVTLYGAEAQQAIDAMLEAAANVESMGRKVSYSLGRATPQDREYLAAVEAGDMEAAQRMVDAAARAAGYNVGPVWRADTEVINVYDNTKLTDSTGFFFFPEKSDAVEWGESLVWRGRTKSPTLLKAYLKLQNPREGARIEGFSRQEAKAEMLRQGFDGAIHLGGREILVFDPNQIKSADPVTRDDQGNVIPLSQRFNPQDNRITYALAPAKFSEQVMTELEQQLGKDPAQRWAYGVEILRRISKLSPEVDQMAAADLTSKQRIEAQTQFTKDRYEELLAEMPPGQTDEAKFDVMTQARKEGEAWAAQNKADAPGQRDRIIGYQRIVNAALMGLPKNLRTDIGGFLQVADARSATTALKAIKKHIARIGETVERYLKEEIQAEVKALIKRGKPRMKAGEKPSSDIGAEASNLFAMAAAAIKMNEVETLRAISDREDEIDNPDLKPTLEREQQLRDEIEIINLAGDFSKADAAQSKALLDTLQNIYDGGYLVRLDKLNRDKAKIERLKDMIKSEVMGKLGIDSVQGLQAAIAQQRTKGTASTWWDVAILEGGSFNTLLYKLVGENSEVAKELLNMERKADNDYQDLNDAMEQDITAFFTRIGNGDAVQGQRIVAAMAVNTKKGFFWKKVKALGQTPVRHTIKVPGKADAVEVTSQMEAIHDLMMWRQPDGKRNMSGKFNDLGERTSTWGYDEDWANSVMGQLTPEAWQVMDWLTQRYQAEGVFLDPLVRDRLGVMMPANPIYSPLTNVSEQVKPGQMQDPISGSVVNGTVGITPTALKTRNKSINRPRKANALQVYIGHTKQMNHWVAKYDYARTIQQLFLNRDMLDYVQASGGEVAQKLILAWVDHAVAGGIRDATVQLEFGKFFDRMGSRAAQAAILGRASTLMVQTTQLAAASMRMPMRDFIRLSTKLYTGQLDWSATINSPFIQRRIAQKSPLVQRAMQANLSAGVPSNLKYSQQWFASALTNSDAYVTAATHTMLYHHQLEVAESMGMTGAEAQEYAASEADRLTEEVAQPVRQSQRSMIELNKKFSFISPFISEARQKLSLLFVALDKVKQDPSWDNWGELARVSNYLFLVNGMFVQAIKKGWLLARTPADDRPEIDIGEMMLRMAAESLASPLTGAPGFQFLTEGGSLLSALPRAGGAFGRVSKALLTDESVYDGDPVKMMRDADLLISAMSLFSDSAAVMSSYSHVFTDLAKLIDAQTQD